MKKYLILLLTLFLASCGMDFFLPKDATVTPGVSYRVYGTCGIARTITVSGTTGDLEKFGPKVLPWSYEWEDAQDDDYLYISAQSDKSKGDITVEIWKDGKLIEMARSTSAYAIVTAYR